VSYLFIVIKKMTSKLYKKRHGEKLYRGAKEKVMDV